MRAGYGNDNDNDDVIAMIKMLIALISQRLDKDFF